MNPQPKNAAIYFIFVTVVLDVLSLGVVIPVLPKLIKEFLGGDTSQAVAYNGLFTFVWALMQFIFSPIIGGLSDQLGRRRVLLFSCFGLGLDYIFMALAPSLMWLLVGRIVSGITAASFATAAAYIADITPPEKRAASYGMIGAAFGVGFVLGPAVGGWLGEIDLRLPFWLAAGLTLLNAAYGYCILPESLAIANRRAFSWSRANPLGSLRLLRSHPDLLGLATVLFLYQLAHQVFSNVFVLYTDYRYQWSPETVGFTLMAVGISSIVVQGFLVRRAAGRLGERVMLFAGLAFGAVGYFIYGIAPTGTWFWGAIPVFALVAFFSPAIQGLMTRRVQVNEQGQLQGTNSSLMGIAGMVGPVLFAGVFVIGIWKDSPIEIPGAPFFLASTLHLIAILVAWQVTRNLPKSIATRSSSGTEASHMPAQHELSK